MSAAAEETGREAAWRWPVNPARYDRSPTLTGAEARALQRLGTQVLHPWPQRRDTADWTVLDRLLRPLDDAVAALSLPATAQDRLGVVDARGLVLLRCRERGSAFWAWSDADWVGLIGRSVAEFKSARADHAIQATIRPYLLALAYLLCGFSSLRELGPFNRLTFAWRVFGRDRVEAEMSRVGDLLTAWGYSYRRAARGERRTRMPTALAHLLLVNRSPLLEDLTTEAFDRLRRHPDMRVWQANTMHAFQRACAALGYCDPPPTMTPGPLQPLDGAAGQWVGWVERWYATSIVSPAFRLHIRSYMGRVGRWLAAEHPEITEPAQWTRQTCAAWVAAVDRLRAGDYIQRHTHLEVGKPLASATKQGLITATRVFFRDCQEWEWIPRRFDPQRALATPRTIRALIGPNPRVIADDVWAKLLWAGMNLEAEDLPASRAGAPYPIELSRAVTLTWLFSGQRSDEIARLRVGCIRWQHNDQPISANADDVLARDAVCLLDVPAHKTGTAFTKPVDPLLGQAIEAWQAIRPVQPAMLDRKTGERVHFLFTYRAKRVAKAYINQTLIPALCRKAGVPNADSRGAITSHRARSTIASQLYNAKEPMTLFELQEWLNHRSPRSTQYYTKITPTKLAKAYQDAGYFARNLRTVEVLVDRDAVASGTAAAGQPWQYYDLGHGWCTYTFFEQCPHRMACARCHFYAPKDSTRAQLLEAKTNLQRMTAAIPLTDEERAAIDDGQDALDRLLARLADTPTPAGPSPRDLAASATQLPIVGITNSRSARSPAD
jgi:integrase